MPSPFREQNCQQCGGPFEARKVQPFCSKACSKIKPLDQRFWAKVRSGDECWTWTGATSSDGYGRIRFGDGTRQATAVAWYLHFGVWPEFEVCHRCDNPPCVRPDHLFLGSHKQNMMDAVTKGRIGVGLTEQDAAEIRALAGTISQVKIAERFGIGQTHVSRIIRGKAWA